MNRLFRLSSGILALLMLTVFLSACTEKNQPDSTAAGKLNIYATFYPFYALTEMLMKDTSSAELHCLVQPQDGCLRSYQLSNWDLALLSGADAVIAGGRGLESFENLLYTLGESGPAVIAAQNNIQLIEQSSNAQADTDSHWNGSNPHIYMSMDGAVLIAEHIAAGLSILDGKNEDIYAKNLNDAKNILMSVYNEASSMLQSAQNRSIIVMNEALIYTAQEFGLDIELCYERESGESLEDFDLENCLEQLSQCESKVILIEQQAPQSLCRALEAAGFQLAKMDVLSTHRANEGSAAFLKAYLDNARTLAAAFEAT